MHHGVQATCNICISCAAAQLLPSECRNSHLVSGCCMPAVTPACPAPPPRPGQDSNSHQSDLSVRCQPVACLQALPAASDASYDRSCEPPSHPAGYQVCHIGGSCAVIYRTCSVHATAAAAVCNRQEASQLPSLVCTTTRRAAHSLSRCCCCCCCWTSTQHQGNSVTCVAHPLP
jgi:hypothetical protein